MATIRRKTVNSSDLLIDPPSCGEYWWSTKTLTALGV